MAFVDDAQAKGADFRAVTSYADLSWADQFMAETLQWGHYWNRANGTQQQQGLNQATHELDQMVYLGRKLYINQDREWPRYLDLGSIGDIYYLENQIPIDVVKATVIQAAYILREFLYGHGYKDRQNHQQQGLTGITRTGASESYDHAKARRHQLCREAYELLIPYLHKTGDVGVHHRELRHHESETEGRRQWARSAGVHGV